MLSLLNFQNSIIHSNFNFFLIYLIAVRDKKNGWLTNEEKG